MKKYIIALLLMLMPFWTARAASTDYYIKIPDIDGESTDSSAAPSGTDRVSSPSDPEEKPRAEFKVEEGESLKNTGVEPDEIDFDSGDADDEETKGHVEAEFKVEKGESKNHTNFAILLGTPDTGKEISEQKRAEIANIILAGLAEGDLPAEELSLNYGKIKAKVRHEVKLFGFIPVQTTATVEVDEDGNVDTSFPWWAFLATGKDGENFGQKLYQIIADTISNHSDEMNTIIQD